MSNRPAVSIVLPVYNARPYLELAVASIFAQTYTDWELIAIDDASTDGSWEYLQSLNDPRVRVFRNDRNMNQSYSQNRGNELAQGKWIMRMDADDASAPTRLEKQVKAMEADPKIDVIGCETFLTDRDLNLISRGRRPETHAEITRWPSLDFPLSRELGKREWFLKWRYDKRIRLAQDFDIFFRSHRQSVFANLTEPLYIYRFVGHTRSLRKMITSVSYKCKSLTLNGFRMGIPGMTLLGLASMMPRPLLYTLSLAVGKKTGMLRAGAPKVDPADAAAFEEALAAVRKTEVPRKTSVCFS